MLSGDKTGNMRKGRTISSAVPGGEKKKREIHALKKLAEPMAFFAVLGRTGKKGLIRDGGVPRKKKKIRRLWKTI